VPKDPLFAQVLKRRTNRSAYDIARPVPAAAWTAMADAVKPNTLRFGFAGMDQPEALKQHRATTFSHTGPSVCSQDKLQPVSSCF